MATLSYPPSFSPQRQGAHESSCHHLNISFRGIVMMNKMQDILEKIMRPCSLAVALSLGLFLSFPAILGAQQTTAALVGNVTDPTGATVGGATVTATNTGTNLVRTTKTEADGKYSIPSLAPGPYTLTVEMAGFETGKVSGIILDASQTGRQDFKLDIGQVTNTVTVEASTAAAQLQTENGAVGE